MKTLRILITGSRDWDDPMFVADMMMEEDPCSEHGDCDSSCPRIVIVHGACPSGADKHADKFAHRWGVDIEFHPAKWNEYGKSAGFVRNAEMVELGADVCLAFIKNGSAGATHTADLAEAAGIPVKRFER